MRLSNQPALIDIPNNDEIATNAHAAGIVTTIIQVNMYGTSPTRIESEL
ncbi:hypothetical protein PT2222_420054 [Paraburkholderia tropica]